MNPRRQQAQEEKFCRICEACATPEHQAQALERMLLEYLCVIDIDPQCLDEPIREKFAKARAPRGWRKNALEILGETIFAPFKKEELETGDPSYLQGRLAGVMRNIRNALEAGGSGDAMPTELSGYQETFEQAKASAQEMEKLAVATAPDLGGDVRGEFLRGYKKGEHALFSVGTKLAKDRENIKFYLFMFLLGDYIELFHTVDELREYAKIAMGPDFSGEPESFNKACYLVKFQGARYLKSRRNRKVVDRAKRRIH